MNVSTSDISDESVLEVRRQIRLESLAERDAVNESIRHGWSDTIVGTLRDYLTEKSYRFIHCYISFRSEVETRGFIEASLEKGWRVVVPVVEHLDGREFLVHTEIKGLQELQRGRFGLEEPVDRTPSSLEALEAVIVPIAAFDRRGMRLGYGKGFYDIFLSELPASVERIGLAFAMQEVTHIPRLPHDETVGTMITERGIIRALDIPA